MFQLISRIEQYYHSIDSGNIDEALAIFAPDATYIRGKKTIHGTLEAFYRHERNIGQGKHKIEMVTATNDTVNILGQFTGEAKDGQPLQTTFKDTFVFKNGFVVYRKTVFIGKDI